MPISLAEVKDRIAKCDVYDLVHREGFKKGELIVEYHILDEDTVEEERRAALLVQDGDTEVATEYYIKQLCRDLVSWDLSDKPLDKGGKLIPITQEALRTQVPSEILQDILAAIRLHKRPGEVNGRSQRRR